MKISREEIHELIRNKIFGTSDTNAIREIEAELTTDSKFSLLEFNKLCNETISLDSLNVAELYWIITSASKYIKYIQNPEKYFDEGDIKNALFYIREKEETIGYPIVFENVEELTPTENTQFGFYLSVKQIALLKRCGILEVIPNLQRGGKKNRFGDLVIDIKKTRFKQIKNVIESGKYFYDQIRINLINDETSNFEYDSESRKLTIFSGTLIIPDGNHRATACEISNLDNINSENKFSVAFTFLTPMQTQDLLVQTWNTEPIKNRKRKSMETTSSNRIIDSMIRNENADPLYINNIVKGDMGHQHQNGFILYDVLSKAIKKHYNTEKIETQDERLEISEWLVNFFNKLSSILVSDFKDYMIVKNVKWSIDPNAFIGYIMLSKYLIECSDWKNRLTKIIKSIDFNITNSPVIGTKKHIENSVELFFKEVINNDKSE